MNVSCRQDVQGVHRWLDLRVDNLEEVSSVFIISKIFKFDTMKLLKILKHEIP